MWRPLLHFGKKSVHFRESEGSATVVGRHVSSNKCGSFPFAKRILTLVMLVICPSGLVFLCFISEGATVLCAANLSYEMSLKQAFL